MCALHITLYTLHNSYAAFIDPGWGTRGAGKGGAFIASVDDASAVMWNPAGLSQMFIREAIVAYHKPYAGLEGLDLKMGHFSVGVPVYGVANFGAGAALFNCDNIYKETTIQVSAAREMSELIDGINPMKLALGVNIKYLSHEYVWDDEIKALDDPITRKDSAGGVTADIGVLFQPIYEVPVGLTVKNLIPADVGLENEDIVPLEASIGAAYRIGTMGSLEDITPEFRIGFRDREYDRTLDYAVGVETWLGMHTVGLRAGYNNNEIAAGLSFERFFGNIGMRLDYAALISRVIRDNYGSHRVSMAVKF
ncbi:MAG: type IX secretion system membrane protein PorP/SprF [Elusimicrobia bacterium]|nr:type IX secretion system membrane protein PorP/SprF [Elusimicrobiota bacterium]